MKIIELIIDEDAEIYGIDAISLVDKPAIESDFVALSKQKVEFAEVDADKRILMGPALIPDKPIFRKNGEEEFYVYFSKSTVRKAAELYLKHGNQANATLQHEHNINGVTLMESWLVEDPKRDKSAVYGMDVPVGTWMVTLKVDNDAIWQEWVKEGKVKGFSIEGYFATKAEKEELASMVEELTRAIVRQDARTKTGKRVVLESFSDYPEAVSNNAKSGILLNQRLNNKCATQVGKVRAQQLAQKEPVSIETIRRMYSYLSRADEYYDPKDTKKCGTVSYLLWGGKAGLRWSKSKLRELEILSAVEREIKKTDA